MTHWITQAISAMAAGNSIEICPRGHSMRGLIDDGQQVYLEPVDPMQVQPGQVVLIRWRGNHLLHIALGFDDDRVLIGNNHGKINGYGQRRDILGRVKGMHADLDMLAEKRKARNARNRSTRHRPK